MRLDVSHMTCWVVRAYHSLKGKQQVYLVTLDPEPAGQRHEPVSLQSIWTGADSLCHVHKKRHRGCEKLHDTDSLLTRSGAFIHSLTRNQPAQRTAGLGLSLQHRIVQGATDVAGEPH